MNHLRHLFNRKILEIYGVDVPGRMAVALSGGVDSMALASVASEWAKIRGVKLYAYIVDHKLRPESTLEAEAVRQYAEERFKLEKSEILTIQSTFQIRPGVDNATGLESWARNRRIEAFYKACLRDCVQSLLLAHHFDDQKELFVMRLLAESYWRGLAGMQQRSPLLNVTMGPFDPRIDKVRPFLDIPKSKLIEHCVTEKLTWWEDPTNRDINYTQRNLIRRYFESVPVDKLPKFLRPRVLRENIQHFAENNNAVMKDATQLYSVLNASGILRLDTNVCEAWLEVSDNLLETPSAVLQELLFRVAVQISPKSPSNLSTSRHKLKRLVDNLKKKHEVEWNCLQVMFVYKNGKLHIHRESPRRSLERVIFNADVASNHYVMLDNRWWIKFSVPSNEFLPSKNIEVRFLKYPESVIKLLHPNSSEIKREELTRAKLQPLLMWLDPSEEKHSVVTHPSLVIGYPTLGLTRSLNVECVPKRCYF